MRGATGSRHHRCRFVNISIHAPHARSDTKLSRSAIAITSFQSTLLMRGATRPCASLCRCASFQSTLLMRGATRDRPYHVGQVGISIHAPHARSDKAVKAYADDIKQFQSTLLMRGATVSLSSIDLLDFIIHFSRTTHLFPKTLLLALCLVSPIFCVMALRA